MSAEVCLEARSGFDRRNEPHGLAGSIAGSLQKNTGSKTFVINQGAVHRGSDLVVRINSDARKKNAR